MSTKQHCRVRETQVVRVERERLVWVPGDSIGAALRNYDIDGVPTLQEDIPWTTTQQSVENCDRSCVAADQADSKLDMLLLWMMVGAAKAATAIVEGFKDEGSAQAFYDQTHGPLPFARSLYADERVSSTFVQVFLLGFEKTGFQIYGKPSQG